jgi:hypothetical protein
MFNFDKKPHDVALNKAITQILITLSGLDEASEEYNAASDQLVKLLTLKKETNSSWRPSPDAIVGGAVSILGILLILKYEKLDVVTSKALSFVGKTKP